MKFKLLTLGTRGDVQPFISLGQALQKAGHSVTICTADSFKAGVLQAGIEFASIRADFLALTQSEEGKKLISGNPVEIMRKMKSLIYPLMKNMLTDLWTASQGAEALIYHPKAFGGYDIAEKLNVPVFTAHPVPLIAPTSLFTNPVFPFSLGLGWLNRRSYVFNRFFMSSFMKIINPWREQVLGLPGRSVWSNDLKVNGREIPVLYGCSPTVIPYDPRWKGRVSMAGFWFLNEEETWQPPEGLADFLHQGPAPLVFSFSSMPLKQPALAEEMIAEALRRTERRAVLITGWSGMKNREVNEQLHVIDSVPHSWLFPRSAGVIHHGGAGTTAEALRSGKPMLVCPFTGDQPFWARRMRELGVSVQPLREKEMTVEAFTQRIRELTADEALSHKAQALAQTIQQENGPEETVRFIHKQLEQWG